MQFGLSFLFQGDQLQDNDHKADSLAECHAHCGVMRNQACNLPRQIKPVLSINPAVSAVRNQRGEAEYVKSNCWFVLRQSHEEGVQVVDPENDQGESQNGHNDIAT